MRYFLFFLLLSLVGCDEPYNLVEQEYFEQIDSEIEQHVRTQMIDQVVEANALEPRGSSGRRESLLRKADRHSPKVLAQKIYLTSSDTPEATELVYPPFDSEILKGKESGWRRIRPDSQITDDVFLSVVNQGRSFGEHPVALRWWNETALWNPFDLKEMHRDEFVGTEAFSE